MEKWYYFLYMISGLKVMEINYRYFYWPPNTGLVSGPFPPLLTGVWVGIVVLYKWGEVPNIVIKYFIGVECRRKLF